MKTLIKLTKKEIEEIRKNPNDQVWSIISSDCKLTEDFIREFKDDVQWLWISYYQTLSENFIREFKDKIWWGYISINQKLSEDFIYEFIDRIDIDHIIEYQTHLSTKIRNKIKVIHELKK